ncbi:STAS domain-containing protein [Amycolatopsis sp. lyj-23]|uniref:STAS domain-containing protein n=1 Tax=Amycolatopsis sp. lyj-23 TaxID=2789283 RepID=UPI0039797BF1
MSDLPSAQPGPAGSSAWVAVERRETAGVWVLAVTGEVDLQTGPVLQELVFAAVDQAPARLVLDLSAVRFFSAAGLTVLVAARQRAGNRTVVRVVGGPVAGRVITVTGVDQLVAVSATLEQALRGDAGTAGSTPGPASNSR